MGPFRIAVASGKGGTGKTTVSVNLASTARSVLQWPVLLADCDVEEPNDAIFFHKNNQGTEQEVFQLIPEINPDRCTYCRKCAEYCEFNAIVVIPPAHFAEVNNSLCHSCGACLAACEYDALQEKPHPIGHISAFSSESGLQLAEGRLKIGSAMQTMLIRELKKSLSEEYEFIIFDAPPGTSCPVVETISDTDYIILVTEPTPFGLHDLKLMADLVEELDIPAGVVINKAGIGNREVYEYLEMKNIEIIGELPFNKDYAGRYAAGELLEKVPPEMQSVYNGLVGKLIELKQDNEGNHHTQR